MKRSILIVICALILFPGKAQEKYSVVLEQARNLSPYEAIYLLMDYQYWHPEYSNIYYQLGNLCYDLLPTRDPLHHYSELSTLLYQSRLFYGNCLHFAKDQKLPGWQYAELAQGQKRIEYPVLEQYIRPRLEEVKRQQVACDSIHRSFVRMTERYNRCQALFTDFLRRYSREKTAHLNLTSAERKLLLNLRSAADSLDTDIAIYQTALSLQAIEGYHPVFRKEPVVLYRLDGLTHTDFLQNDIATWDYSTWVTNFLDEQSKVYEKLYADLTKEQQQLTDQLSQYRQGKQISGHIDPSLVGRCARLELQTPQVDSVRAMQEAVLNAAAQQTIAQSAAPKTIRELMPLLQIAASRRAATPDSAILSMNNTLIQLAQPLSAQQQPTYTHPVTGEIIRFETLEGEHVHALLPDENGYRCVITDEFGATCVLCLNRAMITQRRPLRQPGEKPLVFTKLPGQVWVLITDKDIYWLE